MLAQFTTAPETKFVPFIVSTNATPPAPADEGERAVIVGAGIGLTVKAIPDDMPAGVATLTLAVPALVMRLAGTTAVSCVALTKVVVSAVLFQFTAAPETKFVPFTVSVNAAPPAVAEEGESAVMVGSVSIVYVALAAPLLL